MPTNPRWTILTFFKRFRGPAVAFTCALTILIWMKLRLTTGVPRSVYAVPEAGHSPGPSKAPPRPGEPEAIAQPKAGPEATPGADALSPR